MEIVYYKTPFEHVIIKNVFSEIELKEINTELDKVCNIKGFLNSLASKAGTAKKDGNIQARKVSFFLDQVFYKNLFKSKIYIYATKPFKPPLSIKISKNNTFGVCLKAINNISLLVSMYKDSDYYLPHSDKSLLTGTCFISKNVNNIAGGELHFPEYKDFKILPEFNTFVLFPSYIIHGVLPVDVIDKTTDQETVRISLNMFTYVLP
jgi:Rps23 Pro-64 3,4-dihydroxylase Tpa1-like proline 4-hydroxylase